jgi:hypothetical protein
MDPIRAFKSTRMQRVDLVLKWCFARPSAGQPGSFTQLVTVGSAAVRTSNWYEMRMRISFASTSGARMDAQYIDQTPPPGPVSSGPAVTLDNPALVVGSKIGLWCSSTTFCEFRDFVIVKDALRGGLVGSLDCQACNLMWQTGSNGLVPLLPTRLRTV